MGLNIFTAVWKQHFFSGDVENLKAELVCMEIPWTKDIYKHRNHPESNYDSIISKIK